WRSPSTPTQAHCRRWTSPPPIWSPGSFLAQRKSGVQDPPDDYGPAQPSFCPGADDQAISSMTAADGEVAAAAAGAGLLPLAESSAPLQAAVTAIRPDGVKYHNQSVTRITD